MKLAWLLFLAACSSPSEPTAPKTFTVQLEGGCTLSTTRDVICVESSGPAVESYYGVEAVWLCCPAGSL